MPPIKGDDGTSGIPIPAPGTFGVEGDAKSSYGVVGTSGGPAGVYGESSQGRPGEFGTGGQGVLGVNRAPGGIGVEGRGENFGVQGIGGDTGVQGYSDRGSAIRGSGLYGVVGYSTARSTVGAGAFGQGVIGVRARNTLIGDYNEAFLATVLWAGDFHGPVSITGALFKAGGGFLIDHPLDPANKYLHHSFVESPDRKNFYDGIAVLDGQGQATVELPTWFSVLNRDFRYQLTCLGSHAPVFVAGEIEDNCFRIGGGSPGLKVSWLVTGIRQDPWANANAVLPEHEKPDAERGSFIHPDLYGQPAEKSVQRARHPPAPEPPAQLRDLGQQES